VTETQVLQLAEVGEARVRATPPNAGDNAERPEHARTIEIVAPDRSSTSLLMEHAAPWFEAEIVLGSECTIRLRPPAEGIWVFELIALVEGWLEAARLGCAKLSYGQRSYLIRASKEHGPYDTDARSAPEAA
jgi:hypothetical protein